MPVVQVGKGGFEGHYQVLFPRIQFVHPIDSLKSFDTAFVAGETIQ